MDIVTKKQLNILIQLAMADKHFAKAERDMIFKIAHDKKFSDEDVNTLICNPEPIDTLGALSSDKKFEYLMACINLMFADHNIFESELVFCKSIAIKLGFKKNVVNYIVESFENIKLEDIRKKVFTEFI